MSFVGSATLYGEVTWTVLKAEKTRNRSRRRALKIEWIEKVLNGIRFLGACRNQYGLRCLEWKRKCGSDI